MKTNEGNNLEYDKEYYLVCYQNHEIDIGTSQELKLYKPYECVFHLGSKPNLFGRKIFESKNSAIEWCNEFKK